MTKIWCLSQPDLTMFKNSAKEILALLNCNKSDMYSEGKNSIYKKERLQKMHSWF
jgi:hypothetical protein